MRRRRYQSGFVCGELTACRSAYHHVEHDLAVVFACFASGSHPGDDALRPGAMPDELQLVAGEQPLADQHLVECGAHREHVVGE